jgi:sugar phosphate isomerase/epimerase
VIHSALVSITFRKLTPREIVDLVAQTGLDGIEWGGDVHIPHGNLARARDVRQMTRDAGLQVPAYGSYYRVGHKEPCPFEAIVDTAVELGTPAVRVWAGKQGSEAADQAYWDQVVQASRRIADLAASAGVTVAYEYHSNTLTDTNASAKKLLEDVAHPNIKSYWQPPRGATVESCLEGLDAILPWLLHVHVFSWRERAEGGPAERLPLVAGEAAWARFLRKIASAGHRCFAEIEFVQNDAPESFVKDAATLLEWLSLANAESDRT